MSIDATMSKSRLIMTVVPKKTTAELYMSGVAILSLHKLTVVPIYYFESKARRYKAIRKK